jgi:hypothetical protein
MLFPHGSPIRSQPPSPLTSRPTRPSQLTLLCKSECGCAFQSKFSSPCAGATASGTIAGNARQTLTICPGTAWDDGIFITGSILAIGRSVVWFVANTAQTDNAAPLPATNLLDAQSSKLVHLRETRRTTYEDPDTSNSAFQIGYVSDGPQCPTMAPTTACDLTGFREPPTRPTLAALDFAPVAVSANDKQIECCDLAIFFRSIRCAH